LLKACFRNAKAFKVLEDDKVLKDFCIPLISLLAYLVRSFKDPCLLQIPLSDKQRALTQALAAKLDKNEKDIQLLHNLSYTFSAPPSDHTPIGKWSDPLLCFLAIYNLYADGSMKPILSVTRDLAKIEYILRSGVLYEFSMGNLGIKEMEK